MVTWSGRADDSFWRVSVARPGVLHGGRTPSVRTKTHLLIPEAGQTRAALKRLRLSVSSARLLQSLNLTHVKIVVGCTQ